jgi:hypothetical protein
MIKALILSLLLLAVTGKTNLESLQKFNP